MPPAIKHVMLLLGLLISLQLQAQDQNLLSKAITIRFTGQNLQEAMRMISRETDATFSYREDYLPDQFAFYGQYDQTLLILILNDLFEQAGLGYETQGNLILVFQPPPKQQYTISGKILSQKTGELLIGATLMVKETGDGVVSNAFGFYSITLEEGRYQMVVRSLGYEDMQVIIDVKRDRNVDFELLENETVFGTVRVISAREESDFYIREHRTGIIKLNANTIKKIPTLFGEFDPLRAAQLLPGIGIANEGNAGFFVRGGDADQNLILLDEAPVYNPNHLLGFFSIFNANAINEMQLFKGNIPANYGGRLSSVLDVRLKEGNTNERTFSGGVGTLSTRLTFEQPFAKGKGSVLLAARRSYLDLFFFSIPVIGFSENKFNFSDLNFKTSYRIDNRNKLIISGYWGQDRTGYQNLYETRWGNQIFSLQWNHTFAPKLFSNLTIYSTNFTTRNTNSQFVNRAYEQRYGINDLSLKQDFTYFPNNHLQIDFGFQVIGHRYQIGSVAPLGERSTINPQQGNPSQALESAAYISVEQELNDRLSLNYGLRWSRFDNFGENSIFLYDRPDVPSPAITEDNIIGNIAIKRGIYNTYHGPEPRVSLRLLLGRQSSIKLAYGRTRQYVTQLQSTLTPSPADTWVPVNSYIPPKISDQASLGYFRYFLGNSLRASVEVYAKQMQNIIEFKPQANFLLNDHLETEVLLGNAWAYGAEFYLRKQEGRMTGWLSYTLAKSERRVNGINQGTLFPSSFDRRHQLSAVVSYQIHPRVNLSANWVYASGVAYTFPVGKYEKDGVVVPYYTSRNSFRLPANHHLDLSATFYRKKDQDIKNQSSFNFSIYNVYNRKNAFAYVFRQNQENTQESEVVKLYFYSIIPSFTYLFKF